MLGELVNHDYLETLTQCYCENHLAVLEEMAHKFGKISAIRWHTISLLKGNVAACM